MLSIEEQYQHPHWQKKRLKIFNRDKWECVCCGSTNTQLHVHHLYYKKDLHIWEYDNEALITVCNKCHKILHNDLAKLSGLIAFELLAGNLDSTEIITEFKNYLRLKKLLYGKEQKIILKDKPCSCLLH